MKQHSVVRYSGVLKRLGSVDYLLIILCNIDVTFYSNQSVQL